MPVEVITAPERYDFRALLTREKITIPTVTLFMAGGITGCPDWQQDMIRLLGESASSEYMITIFNPRREHFPIDVPNAAEEQIVWERDHLWAADIISFWFCKETLCPIVLYELGTYSNSSTPIFVGMDPEYQRRQDVEIQTRLARPEVKIRYTLEDLVGDIYDGINEWYAR